MKNRNHIRGKNRFWDKEYDEKKHLRLSDKPSGDLIKFIRWLRRNHRPHESPEMTTVADLGAGNGRNLIYLARTLGMRGTGFDISEKAVECARKNADGLPVSVSVRSIADSLPLEDNSQDLVLDMMTSHFLTARERENLRREILRILKPGGWLFYKTFLLEGDLHAKRLIKKYPADEPDTYIHPSIGKAEHVSTEQEIRDAYGKFFLIHRMRKSHRHILKGRAFKRRTVSVYMQKR